jgi:hypothetical protein
LGTLRGGGAFAPPQAVKNALVTRIAGARKSERIPDIYTGSRLTG